MIGLLFILSSEPTEFPNAFVLLLAPIDNPGRANTTSPRKHSCWCCALAGKLNTGFYQLKLSNNRLILRRANASKAFSITLVTSRVTWYRPSAILEDNQGVQLCQQLSESGGFCAVCSCPNRSNRKKEDFSEYRQFYIILAREPRSWTKNADVNGLLGFAGETWLKASLLTHKCVAIISYQVGSLFCCLNDS